MTEDIIIADDEIENPREVCCPDCGTKGKVPDWFLGQEIECKNCDFRFTVTPSEENE